jgi:hypothetical protein
MLRLFPFFPDQFIAVANSVFKSSSAVSRAYSQLGNAFATAGIRIA